MSQSTFLREPTTKERIAAQSKALTGRGGRESVGGLFGDSRFQTDLVDMARQSRAPQSVAKAKVVRTIRPDAREIVDGKPTKLVKIDARSVKSDPITFQFKSGGDSHGVTDRLRGVSQWDPVAAGKAMVWERRDGAKFIADGHQRLGLAHRLAGEGKRVRLDAYLLRESDGWHPRDVRAHAALKNMKELSGTSLDMAKVVRERPDLINGSLPLSDAKIKDAMGLSKLSEPAFKSVVGGAIRPEVAAHVGASVKDAARHADLVNELIKNNVTTAQHARVYVGQINHAPTIIEHQNSLFGAETNTRSLVKERAQVLDKALTQLKSDKRIFGLLEREAANIESAGNKLVHAANAAKAEGAGRTVALVEKLSTTKGHVSNLLDDAARAVAGGQTPAAAGRAFVKQVGDTMKRGGVMALMSDTGHAPPVAKSVALSKASVPAAKPVARAMRGVGKPTNVRSLAAFALVTGGAAALSKIMGPTPLNAAPANAGNSFQTRTKPYTDSIGRRFDNGRLITRKQG